MKREIISYKLDGIIPDIRPAIRWQAEVWAGDILLAGATGATQADATRQALQRAKHEQRAQS